MIKTRTWIIVISLLLIICTVFSIFLFTKKTDGTVANIYQNGVCIYSIDLSESFEPYELTVKDSSGENTIRVEEGRICIIKADCPDNICVNDGWLSDNEKPIVCLPHRLVIKISKEKEAAADSVAQ